MGYSIAWLAVNAGEAEAKRALGLDGTRELLEIPEAPIAGAVLASGWYLVVAQGCDHRLISTAFLELASPVLDVVACSIEEHVMYSSASFWSKGTCAWSISHDAQRAIDDIRVEGSPPPAFSTIRERLDAQQQSAGGPDAEVDHLFDAPVELAESTTGFRHDGNAYPEHFETLLWRAPAGLAPKKPWWKLW